MDHTEIAEEGAALVRKFELQIEESLATAAELTGYFASARRRANVSPTFGQKLFDHSAELVSLLVQTRGVSVNLHNSAEAATRALRITMSSPNQPKPDAEPQPLLSIVAQTEAA
jgi:hypothetical protein